MKAPPQWHLWLTLAETFAFSVDTSCHQQFVHSWAEQTPPESVTGNIPASSTNKDGEAWHSATGGTWKMGLLETGVLHSTGLPLSPWQNLVQTKTQSCEPRRAGNSPLCPTNEAQNSHRLGGGLLAPAQATYLRIPSSWVGRKSTRIPLQTKL